MRVPNWDIKLAEYVNSLQDYPFVWGENDCLTFVNKCGIINRIEDVRW